MENDEEARQPWTPPAPGALDDTPWEQQLLARAFETVADDDRLHGYAVLGDISRHYTFSDICYLAITGELPNKESSSLFHSALCSCMAVSAGQAPAHIAILSRLSGTTMAGAIAAGMAAIAHDVANIVTFHAPLLPWLANPQTTIPAQFTTLDREWVTTLINALPLPCTLVRSEMTRSAAVIALFYASGVCSPEQVQAAMMMARCCGLPAEPLLTGPEHLGQYPVKVPEFRYVEE